MPGQCHLVARPYPTHATRVPPRQAEGGSSLVMPFVGPVGRKNHGRLAPLGGVVRPRRKERFARSIHRRGRDLGGPSVRAACGGSLSLSWLPRRVVPQVQAVPSTCYRASLNGVTATS